MSNALIIHAESPSEFPKNAPVLKFSSSDEALAILNAAGATVMSLYEYVAPHEIGREPWRLYAVVAEGI